MTIKEIALKRDNLNDTEYARKIETPEMIPEESKGINSPVLEKLKEEVELVVGVVVEIEV